LKKYSSCDLFDFGNEQGDGVRQLFARGVKIHAVTTIFPDEVCAALFGAVVYKRIKLIKYVNSLEYSLERLQWSLPPVRRSAGNEARQTERSLLLGRRVSRAWQTDSGRAY
jgi:hypothetical protein